MAVQYTGTHQVTLVDSTGAIVGTVSNPINISGSIGAGATDKTAFVAGTTAGSVMMGVTSPTDTGLAANNLAVVALDANRNLCVNVVAGSTGNAAAVSVGSGASSVSATGARSLSAGQQAVYCFDLDSDVTSQYVLGVGLRKSALGGSVEFGTLSDPVRIDPTGTTTQPISAASLPLPSGAATSAKQPALGTAGSASTDVITIQGIASMTKLLVTPDSVALPANQSVNVNQLAGTATSVNSGVKDAGTLRVVLATDQPQLTNKLLVTPDANSAINLAQVAGATIAQGHGTAAAAVRVELPTDGTGLVSAAQSGTWTVQPGNTANTTPWLVTQIPATSGGLSISRTLSVNNTTGTNPKGSAGQVYGWVITNTNASARFVKLYNKATAPSVGTDTPVITLVIPGNANGAGIVAAEFTSGIAFGTGIGLGITTGVADADTGAPAANEVVVNLFYK